VILHMLYASPYYITLSPDQPCHLTP
jgi:hypothetical protein